MFPWWIRMKRKSQRARAFANGGGSEPTNLFHRCKRWRQCARVGRPGAVSTCPHGRVPFIERSASQCVVPAPATLKRIVPFSVRAGGLLLGTTLRRVVARAGFVQLGLQPLAWLGICPGPLCFPRLAFAPATACITTTSREVWGVIPALLVDTTDEGDLVLGAHACNLPKRSRACLNAGDYSLSPWKARGIEGARLASDLAAPVQ